MAKTVTHVFRYFLGLEPARSQTNPAEREALARHASGRKRVAEIGVFEGLTSRVLGEAMAQDGVLYGIDPFFGGRLGVCWGKLIARREVAKLRPPRNVKFIAKLSHEALADVPGELDFLFIDGDHSLEGITRDWHDWSPRMAPNGIMALHDTRVPAHNPHVAELGSYQYFERVIRHDPRYRLVEQVDSLSVLQRQPA